jgi:chromosome segregation ATPase
MTTRDFKASLDEIGSNLSASRKNLHDEVQMLKSEFKDLQQSIVEKYEQIEALKNQQKDLISLLDQAASIIDDLCAAQTEVKTALDISNSKDLTTPDHAPTDEIVSTTSPKSDTSKADSEDDPKKWASEILQRVGST